MKRVNKKITKNIPTHFTPL